MICAQLQESSGEVTNPKVQAVTTCGKLASGLRGNGERVRKWRGNGARERERVRERERERVRERKNFISVFPSFLLQNIKICHFLSQNVEICHFLSQNVKIRHFLSRIIQKP